MSSEVLMRLKVSCEMYSRETRQTNSYYYHVSLYDELVEQRVGHDVNYIRELNVGRIS